MLRLIELTAKVSGSQDSMMRSMPVLCGSKSIVVASSAPLDTFGPHAEAERARRLQRVDHVEIVRPGFREILPRMRAGVGGDEMLRPVGGRPVRIVPLQRCRIVLALVAEHLPEFVDGGRIRDQPVPVIMRDLVPEMPEQRAVGLAHLRALALALDVVGLGEVDA